MMHCFRLSADDPQPAGAFGAGAADRPAGFR